MSVRRSPLVAAKHRPAQTSAGRPIAVGDRVTIKSVLSRKELNGRGGTVVQALENGRLAVELRCIFSAEVETISVSASSLERTVF
jgi:hypothetical protein